MQLLCRLTNISRWRQAMLLLGRQQPEAIQGGRPGRDAVVGRPRLTLQRGGELPSLIPLFNMPEVAQPKASSLPLLGCLWNRVAESVCPSGFELSLLGRDGRTLCSNRAKAWLGRALYLLLWPARCPLRLEGLCDSSLPGLGGRGGPGDEGLRGRIIQVEAAAAVTSPLPALRGSC